MSTSDTAYVLEWGAISLPLGHQSRVTCMEVHQTFSEAAEAAEACQFDARVFPITIPNPAYEPGFTPVVDVQKLSELRGLLRPDQVARRGECAAEIHRLQEINAELLSALQRALDALGGECFDWGPAREAIAKATNGSTTS